MVGLCMASWQLEFGWHVFCSLPGWDWGREEKGTRGWMGHGRMVHMGWRLPALCLLLSPSSCLYFLGLQGWETVQEKVAFSFDTAKSGKEQLPPGLASLTHGH